MLLGMIFDQFNDPALGHLSRNLAEMPGLEAFVKTASMNSTEAAALPDTAFAWPEERRFPLHTAEHAALSYSYAKHASHIPSAVVERIKSALEVYEVPQNLFDEVKVAHEESPDDWLCPDLKIFRAKTASDVSSSQDSFVQNYEKLDMPHRVMAGQNLAMKTAQHGLDVHPRVMKVAGLTVSHIPTMRDWIYARAQASDNQAHKQAYESLADKLASYPEESRDSAGLMKLANAVAQLDARAGLERHYDRRLPDPLLTVFNTDKVASETCDIAGAAIPVEKLTALPATFWQDLGGKDLADEVAPGGHVDAKKLMVVLETLPMDLKQVLKAQLRK